ncbi:hypothetical protein KPL70_014638 [Citrus sinensis]|nr:hypothetical protein KPL70_014638 [Citrus sinensis]
MLSAFYGFKIKSCLFDGIDSIVEDWIVDQVHIPEVETGYENVLLVRLLLKMRMHSFQKSLVDGFETDDKCDSIYKVFEGLTVEGILKNWSKIKPMIVKDWSENIDARFHLFGKVRGSQLWGIDIYTDDFDLAAVLMQASYYLPTASPPLSAIQELRAIIWCYLCKIKGGGTIDLEPYLTHSSTTEPTLAPMAVERTTTTRAATSVGLEWYNASCVSSLSCSSANTTDELPERLIGAVRVSHIELKSAVVPKLEPEIS